MGELEGEEHQCVVASHAPPFGDMAHNLGIFPDWESNQRPFGSQTCAQCTEPHQPGKNSYSNQWAIATLLHTPFEMYISKFQTEIFTSKSLMNTLIC